MTLNEKLSVFSLKDVNWKLGDAYYCSDDLSCDGIQNAFCGKRPVSKIVYANFHSVLVFALYSVLCVSSQVLGSDCKNPIHVRIDDKLRQVFLDTHNELRNKKALAEHGSILNTQAADMATMVGALFYQT